MFKSYKVLILLLFNTYDFKILDQLTNENLITPFLFSID